MIAKRIGHLLVSHRNGDRKIDVGGLHGFLEFELVQRKSAGNALSVYYTEP
jgi:hypothetical protein